MEGGDIVSDKELVVNASAPNTGFECDHCGKIFKTNVVMKNHIKHVHDRIREHICEVCAKGFATSCDLNTHRRTHTGEKNFPCHICGQSYSTKQYLQIHTRQHTGEKPHCCEECGKAFADPSALRNHQKQHQTNQPVACEVCGKTFKIKKNLKSHMMIHNNGGLTIDAIQTDSGKRIYSNDFKLEVLKKVQEIGLSATAKLVNIQYNTISNWVNVAKGGHNCQFCGRTFPWKAALERHIVKQHKDGEGDGMKSREGISVTHYPEHFKEEVVAFAKATSQKDAKDRFNLPESTVRMWLMKSDGFDYRGPSYNRSPIKKAPFQGTLQDFLAGASEDINIEAGSSKATETTGPLKPWHAEFLQTLLAEYSGEKLTKVLEYVKTLPEGVLDKLAKEGGHKEILEAEFHFEQDESERKKAKKPRQKKPKKIETEELDFKPKVKELLEDMKPFSSDIENVQSDESDYDGSGTFNENGFDQSDDDDAEEDIEESTLTEDKKFENEEKPSKKEEVKLEEDEVKMEVESESEEEEFDNSKMEPDSESEDKDLDNSNPMDPSVKKERKLQKRRQKVNCDICGKCFKAPSDLEKHMVTHTGARDYKCDICTESFPLLNILTR